ncbi:DUF3316 domain-containing protein [uncultured Vibrio sp.]|uniref:DUF3316 domain-containing protein n=1 Tax=uncultured Vibrio sp. TaxID=114054 RepID=UPI0025E8E4B6|nr:DUF3316 domain-containing protein [uncultured Vibrio sp.]
MKKVILLATALMASSAVFATVNTRNSETTIKTEAFDTQEQAYNAGHDLMDEFKAMRNNELIKELPIHENNVQHPSVKVVDSNVKVEAFSKQRGVVQYRAIVEVDYQYKYRESRNS